MPCADRSPTVSSGASANVCTDMVHKTALPCVLVGCKCDNHPAHRQVDPAVVEQRAKTLVGDLLAFQSSDGMPESQRICLSVMLRAILASRQGECAPSSALQRPWSLPARHGRPWLRRVHARSIGAVHPYNITHAAAVSMLPLVSRLCSSFHIPYIFRAASPFAMSSSRLTS